MGKVVDFVCPELGIDEFGKCDPPMYTQCEVLAEIKAAEQHLSAILSVSQQINLCHGRINLINEPPSTSYRRSVRMFK
jgi:hypothetical protein